MLFLSGQVSGGVAAENVYDSPDPCDGRPAGGFEQLLINTSADLAPGGDGVARQARVQDDRRAGEHRGCLEESLPRLCGDAQPGHELSHDFTDGQDQDAARVDEEGRRVRPLQNAAFCARVEAGPECSRGGRRTELEQWSGRRSHQSTEDTEAPDVWPSRI